ncbi:MAG TPA: ParB/RepB/Spo0J family partition protein, partial [Bacteroidia bacterium]|nr:ParB/RepB/Spo0J family partition protein [Bacteroidia bacterium]
MSQKKSGLGKGLSALLDNSVSVNEFKEIGVAASNAQITTLPVDRIEANPFQPRSEFKEEELLNLADSIRVHGLIQPITVRKLSADKYQIISGERRFRAAQLVGLTNVPVFIRLANDQSMLEMALVENIQRENLNAIEIAISYKRLID